MECSRMLEKGECARGRSVRKLFIYSPGAGSIYSTEKVENV